MTLITLPFITSYVIRTQKKTNQCWAPNTPAALLLYNWNSVSDVLQCQAEARAHSENKRLSLVPLKMDMQFSPQSYREEHQGKKDLFMSFCPWVTFTLTIYIRAMLMCNPTLDNPSLVAHLRMRFSCSVNVSGCTSGMVRGHLLLWRVFQAILHEQICWTSLGIQPLIAFMFCPPRQKRFIRQYLHDNNPTATIYKMIFFLINFYSKQIWASRCVII